MYWIRTIRTPGELSKADAAEIAQYPWGGAYRPQAAARLAYLRGQGFLLRMDCAEAAPLARYTQPDEPVYTDSCLECFLDFYPEDGLGYLNFEMNANGALLCMMGPGREFRRPVRTLPRAPRLEARATRTASQWGVELFLPLELIQAAYGRCDFEAGSILEGNFYKCGDETPQPHYGCWNRIRTPAPDFHQPRYFGQLILT